VDDVGSERRTADGVELAVKHITHRCALELKVDANWLSDPARLTLDFVQHTLTASANSPIVATEVCAVIARLAVSPYLFSELTFSVWANFIRQVAPAIDQANTSGLSPDLTSLLAQLWQRDDIPWDEEGYSAKEAVKKLIEAVGRTLSQVEGTTIQPENHGHRRQISIEELYLYSLLPITPAQTQITHGGEEVSLSQGPPNISSSPTPPTSQSSLSTLPTSPAPPMALPCHPPYVAPTP